MNRPLPTSGAMGPLVLRPDGKQVIASSMYNKGKAFIGAAILLSRETDSEHSDYVVLHLLCEGIEIVLKGLLLVRDYDRYYPRLHKKPLRHDLKKIALETASAYGRKLPRGGVVTELEALSTLYKQHLLRYGGVSDMHVDPRTIRRDKVLRYVTAVLRLAERPRSQE